MESELAVQRLSALAQPARLAAFRALVRAGRAGLAAGELAAATATAPSTLSAQLSLLSGAGLVTARREGRSIIYAAAFDAMAELLTFLMEDCCAGRAEVCVPVGRAVVRAAECCEPRHGEA